MLLSKLDEGEVDGELFAVREARDEGVRQQALLLAAISELGTAARTAIARDALRNEGGQERDIRAKLAVGSSLCKLLLRSQGFRHDKQHGFYA